MKIGVVSDTHGLLRPEAARALAGVQRILHLGDVGKPSVLNELEKIAPVTAVRGNVDREGPLRELPENEVVMIAERYVYMLHDLKTLHLDPAAGEVCRRALRAHARAQLLHAQGRAVLQSRVMRTAAVPAAGDGGIADGGDGRGV
jgi:putative phosphoesterase